MQEWNHLLDAEKQSRILADIYYDDLAKLREDDIKIYLLSVINQHIDDFNDYKAYIEAKLQEAIKNGTVSALAIVTVECRGPTASRALEWKNCICEVFTVG